MLQALLCEGAAGARFQVFFESNCKFFICECDVSPEAPRLVFRCVEHLPGIVSNKPCRHIIRDPGVQVFSVETFKDVNVFHATHRRQSSALTPSLASPR